MLILLLESVKFGDANIMDSEQQHSSMLHQKSQLQVGAATINPALTSGSRDQFEGSGANPDDEDGDVVEGSGDGFEGSGVPPESIDDKRKPVHNIKQPEMPSENGRGQTTTLANQQDMLSRLTNIVQQTTAKTTALIAKTTAITTTSPSVPTTRSTTTTLSTSTSPTTFVPPPRFILPSSTQQTPLPPTLRTLRPQPPTYMLDPTGTLEQLKPGMFALIIGAVVVSVLLIILLVTYVFYRIRKKDEGSYSCEEPSRQPHHYSYAYQKASIKEFYA